MDPVLGLGIRWNKNVCNLMEYDHLAVKKMNWKWSFKFIAFLVSQNIYHTYTVPLTFGFNSPFIYGILS